jgi:hypothetical protein
MWNLMTLHIPGEYKTKFNIATRELWGEKGRHKVVQAALN